MWKCVGHHNSLKCQYIQLRLLTGYTCVILHVRNTRPCHNYAHLLYRARLLTIRFLKQGYVATRLKSSLQKFYVRLLELVYRYCVSISTNLFTVSYISCPLYSTPEVTFKINSCPTGAPCPSSQFLVDSWLLIYSLLCVCYFPSCMTICCLVVVSI